MIYAVAGILALLLTVLAGIPYLDFLKKKLYQQYIYEDAPSSHAAKIGTPTTGGIIIVLPAVLSAFAILFKFKEFTISALIAIIVFIMYMLLGLYDDYQKITRKQNKGLGAKRKLIFQSVIALIPTLYMLFCGHMPFWWIPFAVFIIVGSSNAVNLTDGLDGLAAGTSFFAFFACAAICSVKGHIDLAVVSIVIAFCCLGFLWYNKNPAKMFMGDTGSLALGGVLGAIAVLGGFELWLAIIGGVFVIETLSVIIQVISFKTTGRRVFKMSPIHHHFELLGWAETKIVYAFWIAGLVFAIISMVSFWSTL